jgi:hypothetical protein
LKDALQDVSQGSKKGILHNFLRSTL